MHRPFTLVTPDRLRISEGGGCMSLFGLPFFGASVLLVLNLFGVVHIRNADDGSMLIAPLLALMAIAFTTVGGTLVFGRAWTIVDREDRQIIKPQGSHDVRQGTRRRGAPLSALGRTAHTHRIMP